MEKIEKTTGQRIDEMTDKISEVASEIGEKLESGAAETKKVATGIKKWRDEASLEEIVTTITGLILLLLALWALRKFIWGVLLLVLGILCISGFFNPFLKDIFRKIQKTTGSKKESVSKNTSEKGKKSEKK